MILSAMIKPFVVHDAIILARDFHVCYAGAVRKEEKNIFRRRRGIGFALRRPRPYPTIHCVSAQGQEFKNKR